MKKKKFGFIVFTCFYFYGFYSYILSECITSAENFIKFAFASIARRKFYIR